MIARVDLYDTTLRDGTQQEGVSPSVEDKLHVARAIDALGVPYIEGGWPGANPKDTAFFARAADGELDLGHATLVAFGMTRRPSRAADVDAGLRALLDARTSVVCLVGKSDVRHVETALGVPGDENLAMVADSFRLLRAEGRRGFFDAEHFFDGCHRDRAYALAVLDAAIDGGAECVVLCDTNGGTLPDRCAATVRDVVAHVGGRVQVGVHVHNDTDCAVANSLVALAAGATHVQGTINGIGERTGNANLCSIIANLELKEGTPVLGDAALQRLTRTSHEVAEVLNLVPAPQAPYVGSAAFAHKAGLHVSALAKDPDLYQHIAPSRVGNDLRLLVSELSGRSTILLKTRELGLGDGDGVEDATVADRVLERVKELEHLGYAFEAADASFAVLVRRESSTLAVPFALESFRVVVERRDDGRIVAEATVKVWVGDERLLGVAEGDGPVDALDHAFRAAVGERLPRLQDLHLADYKVRILDAGSGTGATTRVLITSTDGEREYTTVGVDRNILEASWRALEDAYLAVLQPTGASGLACEGAAADLRRGVHDRPPAGGLGPPPR